MKGHKDLIVWQRAMDLVVEIYRLTARFPKDELYALTSQLRRAAVSVPSNIAEGCGRNSRKELHQFLGHARGSLAEVETQILIANKLNYVSVEVTGPLLHRAGKLGRMLTGLKAWSAKPQDKTEGLTTSY
jgi:four helix bundle protein